ncbi:hypothetical protein QTO30_16250 [Yoonia sp. GPGPB17]
MPDMQKHDDVNKYMNRARGFAILFVLALGCAMSATLPGGALR